MKETTDRLTDKAIIDRFIEFCAVRGLNQSGMALLAKRTRAWASLVICKKIKSLNFDTRNTLLRILGEVRQDEPLDASRDTEAARD